MQRNLKVDGVEEYGTLERVCFGFRDLENKKLVTTVFDQVSSKSFLFLF